MQKSLEEILESLSDEGLRIICESLFRPSSVETTLTDLYKMFPDKDVDLALYKEAFKRFCELVECFEDDRTLLEEG